MKNNSGAKTLFAAKVTLVTGSFTSAQEVNESELRFCEALIVFLRDSRLTY
jgi:hypothetical protein